MPLATYDTTQILTAISMKSDVHVLEMITDVPIVMELDGIQY
jgi:hypothetical protein